MYALKKTWTEERQEQFKVLLEKAQVRMPPACTPTFSRRIVDLA